MRSDQILLPNLMALQSFMHPVMLVFWFVIVSKTSYHFDHLRIFGRCGCIVRLFESRADDSRQGGGISVCRNRQIYPAQGADVVTAPPVLSAGLEFLDRSLRDNVIGIIEA